jgi:hypothetical protein
MTLDPKSIRKAAIRVYRSFSDLITECVNERKDEGVPIQQMIGVVLQVGIPERSGLMKIIDPINEFFDSSENDWIIEVLDRKYLDITVLTNLFPEHERHILTSSTNDTEFPVCILSNEFVYICMHK